MSDELRRIAELARRFGLTHFDAVRSGRMSDHVADAAVDLGAVTDAQRRAMHRAFVFLRLRHRRLPPPAFRGPVVELPTQDLVDVIANAARRFGIGGQG